MALSTASFLVLSAPFVSEASVADHVGGKFTGTGEVVKDAKNATVLPDESENLFVLHKPVSCCILDYGDWFTGNIVAAGLEVAIAAKDTLLGDKEPSPKLKAELQSVNYVKGGNEVSTEDLLIPAAPISKMSVDALGYQDYMNLGIKWAVSECTLFIPMFPHPIKMPGNKLITKPGKGNAMFLTLAHLSKTPKQHDLLDEDTYSEDTRQGIIDHFDSLRQDMQYSAHGRNFLAKIDALPASVKNMALKKREGDFYVTLLGQSNLQMEAATNGYSTGVITGACQIHNPTSMLGIAGKTMGNLASYAERAAALYSKYSKGGKGGAGQKVSEGVKKASEAARKAQSIVDKAKTALDLVKKAEAVKSFLETVTSASDNMKSTNPMDAINAYHSLKSGCDALGESCPTTIKDGLDSMGAAADEAIAKIESVLPIDKFTECYGYIGSGTPDNPEHAVPQGMQGMCAKAGDAINTFNEWKNGVSNFMSSIPSLLGGMLSDTFAGSGCATPDPSASGEEKSLCQQISGTYDSVMKKVKEAKDLMGQGLGAAADAMSFFNNIRWYIDHMGFVAWQSVESFKATFEYPKGFTVDYVSSLVKPENSLYDKEQSSKSKKRIKKLTKTQADINRAIMGNHGSVSAAARDVLAGNLSFCGVGPGGVTTTPYPVTNNVNIVLDVPVGNSSPGDPNSNWLNRITTSSEIGTSDSALKSRRMNACPDDYGYIRKLKTDTNAAAVDARMAQ